MGKKSKPVAVQNVEFAPHLTANRSRKDEKFYIKVGGSLLLSDKFKQLSAAAKFLFIAMAAEAGTKKLFTFSVRQAERYGIPYRTMVRRITELEEAQFIFVDRAGTTREYNYYSFRTDWKPP